MVLEDKPMTDAPPATLATSSQPLATRRLWQIIIVAFLAALLAIAALPRYFSGSWPWSAPLKVPQIEQLRQLGDTPLDLPDWEALNHEEVRFSGDSWFLTEYVPTQATQPSVDGFALLMRPQTWHTNQPEVEWVDIAGSQSWRTDHRRTLKFAVPNPGQTNSEVTTQYFRSRNDQTTFAVMQWYSWPQGGHPAPGRWFWLDQMQQWRHRARQPWIAVSLILPIEPVGDVGRYEELMVALGQQVQQALLQAAFNSSESG
jgi:cyanoexosortase B-associated protein